MKIAYIGNFNATHSTENHVKQAWEHLGHHVVRVQEESVKEWEILITRMAEIDLVLWTRTASLSEVIGHRRQWRMLSEAKRLHKPTVSFHLDRWWGLDRQAAAWEEPFFRTDFVITADGGHDAEWQSIGVNHVWLPPAVSLPETELGEYRQGYASDITFVGSWQDGYHAEWTHRPELVQWLKRNYPDQMRFWPRPGQPAIRGKDLRDLYASVKIVIGDSCLVGNATRYWSDRIPETVGRGGYLIHPYVEGLDEHFTIGEHLMTWGIGDWSSLSKIIDQSLNQPEKTAEIAITGREHVREHHTYDVRVEQIIDIAGLR